MTTVGDTGEVCQSLHDRGGRRSVKTGRACIRAGPCGREVTGLGGVTSEDTGRRRGLREAGSAAAELHRMVVGRAKRSRLGPVRKAPATVDRHVSNRPGPWSCREHEASVRGASRMREAGSLREPGLERLAERARQGRGRALGGIRPGIWGASTRPGPA